MVIGFPPNTPSIPWAWLPETLDNEFKAPVIGLLAVLSLDYKTYSITEFT